MDTNRSHRFRPLPLAEFVRPEVTLTAIAKEAGVSVPHLSHVVSGARPALPRVRLAAMKLTGRTELELFGDEILDGIDL